MRAREAEARLEMIRALMNRGERWPGLSAGACFTASVLALLTAAWCHANRLEFVDIEVPGGMSAGGASTGGAEYRMVSAIPFWCLLAVACFGLFLVVTITGAVRRGEPPLSRKTWAALLSIAPALFAGAFLTPAAPRWMLPAIWMLCYGAGVSSLGWFAGFPATATGLLFLVAGALSLHSSLRDFPNAMMAAAFGGLHALLGTLLLLQPRDTHDPAVHFDPVEDR